MCGIVAVLATNCELNDATLVAMRDRLTHRGPDGAGRWIGASSAGSVGLAHRRLSIIDLSEDAAQPMFTEDDTIAITFNGEIYNYLELRHQLTEEGVQFRTKSDTEVLLKAYVRWGRDCLDKLNGMFAFAIYDSRDETLFVARDRFGEKPLYYTRLSSGGLALASEVKALYMHPEIEPEIDEEIFSGYLNGYYVEAGEQTFFNNIKRLEPAHAMIIDCDGTIRRKWRYWTPNYLDINYTISLQDATHEFRDRLKSSISMRLRSDVEVGACLSGGLDSSAIVGLLKDITGGADNLKTYSVRFDDDPTISEGPFIDLMLERSGFEANSIRPTGADMEAASRKLHWHQEQPFLSASMFNEYALMEKAKENGTIVILDGQGADELLAGYQYYFQLHQLDLRFCNKIKKLHWETRIYEYLLRNAAKKYKNVERRFNPLPTLTMDELDARLEAGLPSDDGRWTVGVPPIGTGLMLRRQLAIGLLYDQLPGNLHAADRSAMAFGRESRFPFLDRELVDWCIRLPNDMLISMGWQKYILRRATESIVPLKIRWRADKVGYAAPQDNWMRGEIKDWAHDLLFTGPITERPEYDRSQIQELWDQLQNEGLDSSWPLWRWLSASEWLRMFSNNDWKHYEATAPNHLKQPIMQNQVHG